MAARKPAKRSGPSGGKGQGAKRARGQKTSNRGQKGAARHEQTPGKRTGGKGSARGTGKPAVRDVEEAPRQGSTGRTRGGNQGKGGGGKRRRASRGLGGDQVEGRQAVRELLLAGKRQVREVLMIDDLADADVLSDIEDLSHEFGVSLRRVSRRHMGTEALTESHQGVIAKAAVIAEADFESMKEDPQAFILVLDGITDPGNLGAILRTAECAGVTGVVLGRHRSVHISPTVTKTAAGAVEHVPMALVGGIPTALTQLNDAGVFTVGLDGGGDRSIFDLPQLSDGPTALVLGAEGPGLSRLVRQRVSTMASIPLSGELNSLNVATASAVACFEVVRVRNRASGT